MPHDSNIGVSLLGQLPDGFNVATYGWEPDNAAVRAIAADVAGATMYSLLAVAADPDAAVREDSLEEIFRDDFLLSAPSPRRRRIAQIASQTVGMSPEARSVIFGRAGRRTAGEHLERGGLETYEDGAEPLDLDARFLGRDERVLLRPSAQDIRLENDRLDLPAPSGANPSSLRELGRRAAGEEEDGDAGVLNEAAILARFQPPPGIPRQSQLSDFDDFTTVPGPLTHNAVHFRLRRIDCLDQTNGWLGGETLVDKISWASILHGSAGETVKTGVMNAGKFRDGDSRTFSPPRELATFRADVGSWPWHASIVLLLAERDAGGFAKFLDKVYDKVKDKISQQVSKAVAAGLIKFIGKILASIIGAAVAWAVNRVLKWLIDVIKDDVFTPVTTGVWIQSEKALRHASEVLHGFTSPPQVARFKQFGGTYEMTWDVQLSGQFS